MHPCDPQQIPIDGIQWDFLATQLQDARHSVISTRYFVTLFKLLNEVLCFSHTAILNVNFCCSMPRFKAFNLFSQTPASGETASG